MIKKAKSLLCKKCDTCFFKQEGSCILYKNKHLPCGMKAKKVKGVNDASFYINLVNNNKLSIRSLYFSISSLIISTLVLLVHITKLVSGS